jgi:hypothetical protein
MGAPRWRQRPDSNQKKITDALTKIGASWYDASRVGEIPDLIVGYRGCTTLMEIKTEKGKLSKRQLKWHEEWRGHSCVVRSPMQAIEEVQQLVKAHPIR